MFVLGGAYPGLCAPAPTTTTLTVASGGAPVTTVTQGTVVTLTAAVTSGATMITWGQVNFCDATAALCTDIHLLGTAQLIRTGLPNAGTAVLRLRPGTGVHQIKAVYAGRPGLAGYGPSQSAASTLTSRAAQRRQRLRRAGWGRTSR